MEESPNRSYLVRISGVVGLLAASAGLFLSLRTIIMPPKPPDISGIWIQDGQSNALDLDLDGGKVKGKFSAPCFADGSTRKTPMIRHIVTSDSQWDGQTLQVTLSQQDGYTKLLKLRFSGEKLVGTSQTTHPPMLFHGVQVLPASIDEHVNTAFNRGDAKACPGFNPEFWKNVEQQLEQFKKKQQEGK
jgi:hypothetical protein